MNSGNQHKDHDSCGQPKKAIIIVNGREKPFDKKEISFREVVILAFGSFSDDKRICYTVTYKRGHRNKPEGTMVKGDIIKVKKRMIFNVTATDKS